MLSSSVALQVAGKISSYSHILVITGTNSFFTVLQTFFAIRITGINMLFVKFVYAFTSL